jgi:hypothetical protein
MQFNSLRISHSVYLPDDGFLYAETCSKISLKSISPLYTVNVNEILRGCFVVTDKQTINVS